MPFSATSYDRERRDNKRTYEMERDRLEADHQGEWVAIRSGRVVAIARAAADCLAEANNTAPDAQHGFLFQVGVALPKVTVSEVAVNECTDRRQCGNNLINKIALGKMLKKAGGRLEDDYDNDRTCLTHKGKTKCWKWQGPGESPDFGENGVFGFDQCIEITVDNLRTKEKGTKCALLDSGKRGPFMFIDAPNFLKFGPAAEHPDDDETAKTAGGQIAVRTGFVSIEIPQVDFSIALAMVSTNKNNLKAEVEKQKKAEEKKEEKPPKPKPGE
jgi:hypothetical protein